MGDEKKLSGENMAAAHLEAESTDKSSVSTPFHYDAAAEKRLRRKIDFAVVPTVAILYLFCFIDRANIGNARLAGLEDDLDLVGYDYNFILSMFYISYIIFEFPSNTLCKLIGPGWYLPTISLGFGAASIACGFVNTKPQMAGVRFVLGIFEAGMMPGIAYYLSRWYRRSELTFRMSLYIVMAPMSGAFGGLLASGILTLDGFGGVTRWRMIFVIEGIITCGLAIISFFTLTDRPDSAKWLTPEEKALAIARVKSERVGQTEVLDGIDKKKLWLGVWNPMTITTAFMYLLNNITVQGLTVFAPTIVKSIYPGKTTVQLQLLTVPPYIVGAFFTLLLPFIGTKWDRRQIWMIISCPLTMIGYIIFLATQNPDATSARYAACFLVAASIFVFGPITNAQVSANVVSDTAKSSAIGFNVFLGNMGGLVSTWSYLPTDGPFYPIGVGLNLGTATTCLIVSTTMYFWMKKDNAKRDSNEAAGEEELAGMTSHEIEDLDWKHPRFRWNL